MDWLDILGLILDGGEAARWWRFLLCFAASVVVAVFICGRVESRGWRFALAGPVVATGVIGGAIWERRKER